MPNKPKRIVPHWVPERQPFKNLNEEKNRKIYNTTRWRKFSALYKQKNPYCVKCKENGILKASEVTDHVERINEGGDVYDEKNLQALCKSCHNSKSGKEAHGYQEKRGGNRGKNI